MKNLITILLLVCTTFGNAQKNFLWDVRVESNKNKSELFSKTKMFIAEAWVSAKDVTQNNDIENGIILIKAKSVHEMNFQMNNHEWVFDYTAKFYVKDNKFRIVIDNVKCSSAYCGRYDWPLLPVADNYPEKKGYKITGLNEKRYLYIMNNLKKELQSIVDSYVLYMKNEKKTATEEDW